MLMALTTRNRRAGLLSRYYWDTIETCVAPHVIIDALQRAGFTGVNRRVFGGLLSEYTAFGPMADRGSSNRHVGRLDAAQSVTGEESK